MTVKKKVGKTKGEWQAERPGAPNMNPYLGTAVPWEEVGGGDGEAEPADDV
jgi:hypothetical protein